MSTKINTYHKDKIKLKVKAKDRINYVKEDNKYNINSIIDTNNNMQIRISMLLKYIQDRKDQRIVTSLFQAIYMENKTKATKILFYIRSQKFGLGNKYYFKFILEWINRKFPKDIKYLMRSIVIYGSWSDILKNGQLLDNFYIKAFIKNHMDNTLLMKNSPRESYHKELANKLKDILGFKTYKEYREYIVQWKDSTFINSLTINYNNISILN